MNTITRLPFEKTTGQVYRSVMPFGWYDPEGYVYETLKREHVSTIVMLASDEEAQAKAGRNLRELYQQDGINVIQFPIEDFNTPERGELEPILEKVLAAMQQGENIAIHCSAGIGRTGLFAGELAKKAMNLSGKQALQWVREHIRGAVETDDQEKFVLEE
jgi:protein-tyrosine phosphatase